VLWQVCIWPCEGPGFTRISGKWVHGLIQLTKCFLWVLLYISHYKQPVKLYNFVSRFHSPFWSVAPSLFSHLPPLCETENLSHLICIIWWETFKAARSSKGVLKGNKLMHTVCKFHMRAYFPWQFKIFKTVYLKLLMCNLDQFSKIQLHIHIYHRVIYSWMLLCTLVRIYVYTVY